MTDAQNLEQFETWLRTVCFQKPTPEAYDLAKSAWQYTRPTIAAPAQPTCRDDGRCQYAIDHGAEGMGTCPIGQCCQPRRDATAAPAQEPALEAIAKVRAMYPEDIFPEDGDSLDCKSARMARLTCDNIKRELLAAEDDDAAPASTAAPVAPEDPWMLVTDDTPPVDEMVILAAEFDHPGDWRKKVGYRRAAGDWNIFGGSWMPTHWMPLPSDPKPDA
jgi:hypothetical protein